MIVSPTDASSEANATAEAGTARDSASSGQQAADRRKPDVQRILRLPVTLNVELANRDMPVEAILAITVGTIIEFERPFDSLLTLQIGGRTIGHGQAVKAGERFGLRLADIGSIHERIDAMGGS